MGVSEGNQDLMYVVKGFTMDWFALCYHIPALREEHILFKAYSSAVVKLNFLIVIHSFESVIELYLSVRNYPGPWGFRRE